MIIGAMNHPAQDPVEEIRWMAEMRLDFVDFTIEPPAAASWRIDTKAVRKALDHFNMSVVGHTAFYLPLGSAFESLRRASVDEFKRCLDKFAEIGALWMNIHPDRHTPMHDRAFFIRRNIESLVEMVEHAEKVGVGLMIENLPGEFNNAAQLGDLLDPLPKLGLHLDIGHANLMVPRSTTEEILDRYGNRLRHVHLHDNRGGNADLHLPLGAGVVDVPAAIRALKRCGFDGTITLEVFTPDRHYLAYSRDVLRQMWDRIGPPPQQAESSVVVPVGV
jgi:sugar phosphate isomerase/epimerase